MVALTAASCSAPQRSSSPASQGRYRDWTVDTSRPSPAVAELQQRFFTTQAPDLIQLQAEVDRLLVDHRGNGELHEMAALLAELRADDLQAWSHWLAAATDLRSPLALLYLDLAEWWRVVTVPQRRATIRVLEQLLRHSDEEVRFEARRRLIVQYENLGELDRAERLARELPVIRQWKLIGAFDNDQGQGFHTAYGPEQEVDLDESYRGTPLPVQWRDAAPVDRQGLVRLTWQVTPAQWSVAYLMSHVYAEQSRPAQLRLTTSDAVQLWWNGQEVFREARIHRTGVDNVVVTVWLTAGWNRLFVKSSADDQGEWVVGARLTDPTTGAPLTGLRDHRDLHRHPPASPVEARPTALATALEQLMPPLRQQLLASHDASRRGRDGQALRVMRDALEALPHHPLALFFGSLSHWDQGEFGRTIDLMNQGATWADEGGAAFLIQRARFLSQRQRFDRALEDLQLAIELNPDSFLARVQQSQILHARDWQVDRQRVLKAMLDRWPDSTWTLRELAACLKARGQVTEARRLLRRSDRLERGHYWTLLQLAELERYRGQHRRALVYLHRARELFPANSEALVQLADLHREQGEHELARRHLQSVIDVDPQWSLPHQRLGMMALAEGDGAAALAALERALERNPGDHQLAERVDFLRNQALDGPGQLIASEADIAAALARAKEVEIAPGSHRLMVLDDEVDVVHRDGSSKRMITQVWLAVTDDGRDALTAQQIPPGARLLQAYSVNADGESQEASSIREGVVRFRRLDVGSRVVLQYIVHAGAPRFLPNHFVASWWFQGVATQVDRARWLVVLPADRELTFQVQGPVEHRREPRQGVVVHSFTAHQMPPLIAEPHMPPASELLAAVHVSTLTSWDEYVAWERGLLTDAFQSSPELRDLARQLTANTRTRRDKLLRLYRYVAEEIRYQQDYEDTIAGVRPHATSVVFQRGYGDCKDKSVLLVWLAQEVGVELHFALLRTTTMGSLQREVPNQQFNHAIVYAPPQPSLEEGLFLDPTVDGLDLGNLRADDQGAVALVLAPLREHYSFVPIPYQESTHQSIEGRVQVEIHNETAATAGTTLTFRGSLGANLRQSMRTREEESMVVQRLATRLFAGGRVVSRRVEHVDDIQEPVTLALELDVSSAVQRVGTVHRFALPWRNIIAPPDLSIRRTPLRSGPPEQKRWEMTVELPRSGRFITIPAAQQVNHRCVTAALSSHVRGGHLTVRWQYERTCTEIEPEQYDAFRASLEAVQQHLESEVSFQL
jgi:tetratricopeptide (TPR) repeat protein